MFVRSLSNLHTAALLTCSVLVACGSRGGQSSSDGSSDTSTGQTSESDSGSESSVGDTALPTVGSTGAQDSTGTTEGTDSDGEVFDCADIPRSPATTVLSGPRAARGIAFDTRGQLIGAGYEAVYRSTYDAFEVFVPGLKGFGQIEALPGGDFVMADGLRIIRITPRATYETLLANGGDYGIRVGPSGMLYTATYEGVGRIDPATSDWELFVTIPSFEREGARVMDFSPGLDRLYVGTHGSEVWEVELDETLEPIGTPTMFADLSEGKGCPSGDNSEGCWHDALSVDVCGNVYVAVYGSSTLVRISPDGSQTEVLRDTSGNPELFGHGITWGSGLGGFRSDAIYQPTPNDDDNPVAEVEVGVPYRTWTGTVLNGPT